MSNNNTEEQSGGSLLTGVGNAVGGTVKTVGGKRQTILEALQFASLNQSLS